MDEAKYLYFVFVFCFLFLNYVPLISYLVAFVWSAVFPLVEQSPKPWLEPG
jgi:hypothetical protein